MRMNMENVDPDKMEGPDFPAPGSYHFEIVEIDEEDGQSGCMVATCRILAGEPADKNAGDQTGKKHKEFFPLTPKAMGRIAQFGVALGLTTEELLREAKAVGRDPEVPFAEHGPGRQFCGKLVAETYNDKTRNKLNFAIWAVDDKRAKGIPLDTAALKKPELPPASEEADATFGDMADMF